MRRVLMAASLVCGLGALVARLDGVWVNVSPSMPIGVYRTVRGPVTRGAAVVICLPESVSVFARQRGYLTRGTCPGHIEPLGKTVAAMVGDTVDVRMDGVWINGRLVPGSRPLGRDRRGRPLAWWRGGPVVLRRDEAFLLATRREGSYDGRYFGPTCLCGVRATVRMASVFPMVAANGPSRPNRDP